MIEKINDLSWEHLEDLRTHLIQKKIDLLGSIELSKEQIKVNDQLLDALRILVHQKEEDEALNRLAGSNKK